VFRSKIFEGPVAKGLRVFYFQA